MFSKAVSVAIYAITPNLWRWEIRRGGALLRCGTGPTRAAVEHEVNRFFYA